MGASENRFDLLRLLFAMVVFIYHGAILTTDGDISVWDHNLALLAELSVQGFFITSGALVFGSLERSREITEYAEKRIRRLYPAYFVVILIPAAIAAALHWGNAEAMTQVAQYLGANLIFLNFLQPDLPGFLEGRQVSAVNGALWTLKIEVMFYIALPFLAWGLSKLGRFWWVGILAFYLGGWFWSVEVARLDHPLAEQIARQLPGQMAYFASGMALWKLWPIAKARSGISLIFGSGALIASFLVPEMAIMRAAAMAAVVAGVAFAPGPAFKVAEWGDVSYGIYITHFPIVQGLVALGLFSILPLAGKIVVPAALVLVASYALWWTVERPSLRRDSHYRKA
ncbi:MAG: acyltransferase [Pseudomonadota bacterium]